MVSPPTIRRAPCDSNGHAPAPIRRSALLYGDLCKAVQQMNLSCLPPAGESEVDPAG